MQQRRKKKKETQFWELFKPLPFRAFLSSVRSIFAVTVAELLYHFIFYLSLQLSLPGRLTWVRLQQPQEQRYPLLTVRAVFSCVQTKVGLPMPGVFNVHTDVNACDCTRGLYGHCKRVGTES